jgi:flavin-dependent dehydrogenase
MDMYDVVIVGAGPGGLSCARNLAASGLKVLVLEKNPDIGKKICCGMITSNLFPEVKIKNVREWRTISVGTSGGTKSITYKRPFARTVGRYEIEDFLKKGCDADIHFSELVQAITPTHVKTTKGKYKYKYLVGADGAFSEVRRYLGLPTKHIVGWAFHFVIKKPAKEFRYYWLPEFFPRGYGYFMSKNRDMTMVGGASTADNVSIHTQLAPRVREWVNREFKLDTKTLKSEAMKGNADYRGWRFGNVYLVGEAAGLLDPLTTAGMYYAIKSGEGVAKFIRHDPEGEKIMQDLVKEHKWHVRFSDLVWNQYLPFRWVADWLFSNPTKGIRRRIFDYVFWKLIAG